MSILVGLNTIAVIAFMDETYSPCVFVFRFSRSRMLTTFAAQLKRHTKPSSLLNRPRDFGLASTLRPKLGMSSFGPSPFVLPLAVLGLS